jgi:hypothetical protein
MVGPAIGHNALRRPACRACAEDNELGTSHVGAEDFRAGEDSVVCPVAWVVVCQRSRRFNVT